jgi:hypothetical protein
VDPRLRGGDDNGDFHLLGLAASPCTLRMTLEWLFSATGQNLESVDKVTPLPRITPKLCA